MHDTNHHILGHFEILNMHASGFSGCGWELELWEETHTCRENKTSPDKIPQSRFKQETSLLWGNIVAQKNIPTDGSFTLKNTRKMCISGVLKVAVHQFVVQAKNEMQCFWIAL